MFGQLLDIIGEIIREQSSSSKFAGLGGKKEKENVSVFDNSDSQKETESSKSNNINGKIDQGVYQGKYGDCWLLSGVLSMSYTESGAEVIRESINANTDGSVDLYFEGIDKEYTVSAEELEQNNKKISEKSNYSRGDDDALAIELGVEKVEKDKSVDTKFSVKDGGNPYHTYELYGAERIGVADTKAEINEAFNYFEDNSDTCSMTLSVIDKSVCGLRKDHGHAVKEVTTSSVVIVDPWNSKEEIEINRNELLEHSKNLSVVYAEFAT